MPYRVTCPHCETALRVADEVGSASVTCPRCLGLIPNPGPSAGTARGGAMATAVEDEARRDSRGTGCGLLLLVPLVTFAGVVCLAIFAPSADRQAGGRGAILAIVWCWVGLLGFLGMTAQHVWRQMAENDGPAKRHPILGRLIVFVALLTGFLSCCGGLAAWLPG
jgi:hypothetical protein